MAYPVSFNVTAPNGVVRGGRPAPPAYNALLDRIAAALPGSWLKANTNTYQSSWPNNAFLPTFGGGPTSPSTIVRAWSSFAWDDDRARLVIFGGGHGNGSDGEVFMWRGDTLQWELAFHSTDVEDMGFPPKCGARSVAGSLAAPVSAHTYANQVWLPKLQRFITFGGAAHYSGTSWVHSNAAGDPLRLAGPYVLDMSNAGKGYVSAGTGSNVKRAGTASEGVSLTGANAWVNRDYFLDHPASTVVSQMGTYVNGFVTLTEENGHDTIYISCIYGGGTSLGLFRIEFVNNDYHNDLITKVGTPWDNISNPCGGALDEKRRIVLHPALATDQVLNGWDLKTAGPDNRNFKVAQAGIAGDTAEFFPIMNTKHGVLWDERRDYFVLWERGGRLWSLRPPDGANLATGWMLKKIASDALSPRPQLSSELAFAAADSGVHGKWKRSKNLDVYVGLQDCFEGQVWMFKPFDWIDPRDK